MGSNPATTKLPYSWVLWYHDPEEQSYELDKYIRICRIDTAQEFWSLVDSISKEAWESGMFFFLKLNYRPIWEVPENKNGGSWSKKIRKTISHETFIHMMVHCMADEMLTKRKETLVGLTISPKGEDSIVCVWNTDSDLSDNKHLNTTISNFQITDDVRYRPHRKRNITNTTTNIVEKSKNFRG
jgi:hypothetical protein